MHLFHAQFVKKLKSFRCSIGEFQLLSETHINKQVSKDDFAKFKPHQNADTFGLLFCGVLFHVVLDPFNHVLFYLLNPE